MTCVGFHPGEQNLGGRNMSEDGFRGTVREKSKVVGLL